MRLLAPAIGLVTITSGAIAAPSSAPKTITREETAAVVMSAGSTVTIELPANGQGTFAIISAIAGSSKPDPALESFSASLMRKEGGGPVEKIIPVTVEQMTGGKSENLPATEPNRLRITLKQMDGVPGMLLLIANGYGQNIRYRAAITGHPMAIARPTTTCPVLAGKLGVEHWPFNFAYIKISDFSFEPSDANAPTDCH